MGAGLLANKSSALRNAADSTRRCRHPLRRLEAAELIESDLWTQYADSGIGTMQPIELDPNESLNPYQIKYQLILMAYNTSRATRMMK